MALTPEQQQNLEFTEAIDSARRSHELALEAKRLRADMIRLARDTIVENRRNLPVSDRQVTSADIISMADELLAHINQ